MLALIAAVLMGPPQNFQELARHFDYDRSAPVDVRETGVEDRAGVRVHDISYASPAGGRVPAYLVVPDGSGPSAAILFGHWMMPGSPFKNRKEFLDEAVVLARAGAVSLLIDTPMVRPGFVEDPDPLSSQTSENYRRQVIDLRRGLDLLLARSDVDPRRIAYVGHSFDAHAGAILAGIEKRIGSFVLMAGGYDDEAYVFDPDNPEMVALRQKYGDDKIRDYFANYGWQDAAQYLPHTSPSAVFLQYGRKDKPLPEKFARSAYERLGDPKKIAFYDAGHELDAAARRDRAEWLRERLRLRPVDRKALDAIPALK